MKDQHTALFEEEKRKHEIVKAEMRGHHFSYGKSKPEYSSMTSMQYKEHDLTKVNE